MTLLAEHDHHFRTDHPGATDDDDLHLEPSFSVGWKQLVEEPSCRQAGQRLFHGRTRRVLPSERRANKTTPVSLALETRRSLWNPSHHLPASLVAREGREPNTVGRSRRTSRARRDDGGARDIRGLNEPSGY